MENAALTEKCKGYEEHKELDRGDLSNRTTALENNDLEVDSVGSWSQSVIMKTTDMSHMNIEDHVYNHKREHCPTNPDSWGASGETMLPRTRTSLIFITSSYWFVSSMFG